MADMRLAVMGAGGRMGQALIRAITEAPGAVLAGATEREGSAMLGRDAGLVAGVAEAGVPVTDDPLSVIKDVEGILDFTAPAATVGFAALAAQARIVHVIGTTGLSPSDIGAIDAASSRLNPSASARIRVRKMPNCPAAPSSTIFGFSSSGPKSVIAPMRRKMRGGKIPWLTPK